MNLLLIFTALVTSSFDVFANKLSKYDLLMPDVYPNMDELYLCTPIRVDPSTSYYIVGFEPNATMHTAHHMLLYGCTEPGSTESVWNCGEMQNNEINPEYESASPCKSGSQIVYAWARDAPNLVLPPEVGFHVGGDSPIQYMVLQVHYMHKFPEGKKDKSGVYLLYTPVPQPKLAGVILLGTAGAIPPHETEHMETLCQITENKIVHPFAFRTHTHSLGKVVSGYVVQQSPYGDKWRLLGKRDPQTPQMFYPVENSEPIRKDDILAARCTMQSNRDTWTMIGPTNKDEMCNFYLMYYVDRGAPLQQKYCFSPGPPNYYWGKAGFQLNRIPDRDASTL